MIKKNLVLLILLTLYTLFGVWLSINNGISHDAFHEQANWYKNLEGIKLFLTTGEYEEFLNYKDKYHGIGFHNSHQILSEYIVHIKVYFFASYIP